LLLWIVLPALFITNCTDNGKSDAYGQFEATETTISSKSAGELLVFTAEEGIKLNSGVQVGLIDTTQLKMKKNELLALLESTESRIDQINAEIEVLKEQLQTALVNLQRIENLVEDNAGTPQQLDDAEGKVRTLRKQIDALEVQKKSVRAEINATQSRLELQEQQLDDARVVNPVTGTVLTTYVEPFELVRQGQPLYRIANLDTLELRIYVSGAQLPSIRLGQQVEVLIDKNAEENSMLNGRISWIASEAEFTPKMIQTKEERVTQVYAVKVKVPNTDGAIKIGMPGEVNF
ncbi:MAG: HlyD family efflux transporter periplasmic adaptor subunit, partial [Balneolaceae bacterium]|nr:HlyD family efflux transporter periplasmic adaptor subunit [Balneolaceae bacterium]